VSRKGNVDPPTLACRIGFQPDWVGTTHGIQQGIAQPPSIRSSEAKRVTKDPSLVPTARMRRVEAIVFELAQIEDKFVAVRQASHTHV